MNEKNTKNIVEIGDTVEDLAACVHKTTEAIIAIEESLYHANERKDVDMARSAGSALCLINKLLIDVAGQLADTAHELQEWEA